MALKGRLDTLDGLAPDIAAHYTQGEDGGFYAQVEGYVPRSKVDEFRGSNINLKKQLEEFGDIKPADIARMREELAELKKSRESATASGVPAVDRDAVDRQIAQMKQALQEREAEAKKAAVERQKALDDLDSERIRQELTEAALSAGAVKDSISDLLKVEMGNFKWVDGKAVPHKNGSVILGTSGYDPMTPKEYMQRLKGEKKYFFEASTGGGAPGSKPVGGANVYRLTREQARDTALYRKTREAAAKAGAKFELVD